jgi:hypothetical protein
MSHRYSYLKGYNQTANPLTNPYTPSQMADIINHVQHSKHDDSSFTSGDAYNLGLVDGIEKCKNTRVSLDAVFDYERRKHYTNSEE